MLAKLFIALLGFIIHNPSLLLHSGAAVKQVADIVVVIKYL